MQQSISVKSLLLIISLVSASAGIALFTGYSYSQSQTLSEIAKLNGQLGALNNTMNRALEQIDQLNEINVELNGINFELNKTNTQLKNIIIERELEYSILLENYTNVVNEMKILKNQSYHLIYEKIDVLTGGSIWDIESGTWRVTLNIDNNGTNIALLDKVFINDVEVTSYQDDNPGSAEATTDLAPIYIFYSGKRLMLHVYIDGGPDAWHGVTTGTVVNVKIHTLEGTEYSRQVELA